MIETGFTDNNGEPLSTYICQSCASDSQYGNHLHAEQDCDHSFVFLRTEEKNIGYDRNPLWLIQDVFHCQRCCEYKRVDVRKERDREDTFGRRIVENLV